MKTLTVLSIVMIVAIMFTSIGCSKKDNTVESNIKEVVAAATE